MLRHGTESGVLAARHVGLSVCPLVDVWYKEKVHVSTLAVSVVARSTSHYQLTSHGLYLVLYPVLIAISVMNVHLVLKAAYFDLSHCGRTAFVDELTVSSIANLHDKQVVAAIPLFWARSDSGDYNCCSPLYFITSQVECESIVICRSFQSRKIRVAMSVLCFDIFCSCWSQAMAACWCALPLSATYTKLDDGEPPVVWTCVLCPVYCASARPRSFC